MRKEILLLIGGALLISACNPKFYSPNTQNVPLISEKGEANLTFAGNGNQVEFQGAYGITDKFAIQANGGFFIPSDVNNGDGGSGKFFEIGGGYFKEVKTNWIFETYGIVGLGSFENHLPSVKTTTPPSNGDISANLFRIGVQPSFGYKTKNFSAAVSSRFVNLSYNNIKGDLVYGGVNQMDYLNDNKSNFLMEPAITLRGGLEKIKLQVQYGYSLNLTNSNFKQDKSLLTVGLNFNFH